MEVGGFKHPVAGLWQRIVRFPRTGQQPHQSILLQSAAAASPPARPPARTPPEEVGNNKIDELGNRSTREPEISVFLDEVEE